MEDLLEKLGISWDQFCWAMTDLQLDHQKPNPTPQQGRRLVKTALSPTYPIQGIGLGSCIFHLDENPALKLIYNHVVFMPVFDLISEPFWIKASGQRFHLNVNVNHIFQRECKVRTAWHASQKPNGMACWEHFHWSMTDLQLSHHESHCARIESCQTSLPDVLYTSAEPTAGDPKEKRKEKGRRRRKKKENLVASRQTGSSLGHGQCV